MRTQHLSDNETRQKARQELNRSDQAKELLANPLYIEAVTAMRAALYGEFEDSKLDQPEIRHELWQRMQLMKAFQGKFEDIVKRGNKASQTISLLADGE